MLCSVSAMRSYVLRFTVYASLLHLAYRRSSRYNLRNSMWPLLKEFLQFLRQEKKWWLVPLVVLLLILAAIIVFTGGSVLAPLMYPSH